MVTIFKTDKPYKRITNKALIEKFAYYMLKFMEINEIKRYYNEFRHKMDFNIYQYGCLDISDYDLYETLYNLGLRTKAVMNYHDNLDAVSFPYKYRKNIRDTYKYLIRLTVLYMRNEGMFN